jgi:hypothetical protein
MLKIAAFSPHFSPAIYCNAKSAHACCVMLLHPLRRTVKYASSGFSRLREALASTGIFSISQRFLVKNAG